MSTYISNNQQLEKYFADVFIIFISQWFRIVWHQFNLLSTSGVIPDMHTRWQYRSVHIPLQLFDALCIGCNDSWNAKLYTIRPILTVDHNHDLGPGNKQVSKPHLFVCEDWRKMYFCCEIVEWPFMETNVILLSQHIGPTRPNTF